MKGFLSIFLFLFALKTDAQQNRIKLGIVGVPMFQSGFGIGNLGYERIRMDQKASWQLLYSVAGGSPAADVETHLRKWFTAERLWYFKTTHKKVNYYFSVFSEIGNRKSKPGHAHYPDTASLKEKKAFEVNPGTSLGVVIKPGKKISFETAAGPKVLFRSGKEYYNNYRDNKGFTEPFKELNFGLRFLFSLSYQF